jgi:hypothetical protein
VWVRKGRLGAAGSEERWERDFAVPWYSEILKRMEKRQEERLNV